MSYYTLPHISCKINLQNLNLKFDEANEIFINKTLSKYLNHVKKNISKHNKNWDIVKKYTNPYEYIHTPFPNSKYSISKLKPLSRAFFKFIEIANIFDIFDKYYSKNIKSFHLAEGPGGFIEAIQLLRMNNNDKYYGMTLIDDSNQQVPGWYKADNFLKKHPNVIIEKGIDDTGNIYNPDNFKYCFANYKNSMDIITADGGFDFSIDFNKQEEMACRLIFSQVVYAITMQKKSGHFILKFFDSFMKTSVDILFLLGCFYENVHILKPQTSRYANSEKYIVCMNFKYKDTTNISNVFYNMLTTLNHDENKNLTISSILDIIINNRFLVQLKNINAILGYQQMENILVTLRYIENKERKGDKFKNIINKNIQKCISWCKKNKIPYHNIKNTGNIFMNNTNKNEIIN